jgi:formate dehydrogenase beta subunit
MHLSASRTIPIAVAGAGADSRPQRRARDRLKGRQASPEALQTLRDLIGQQPAEGHRRDRLIEHLHAINDAHHGLPEALLVALAQDMKLPVAEVYEVASFYHHFEVLRDAQPGPAVTVRVCDSLSCSLAGGAGLLQRLRGRLGDSVRVQAAPCLGRCAQAPVAQVAQAAVPHADEAAVEALTQRVLAGESLPRERVSGLIDFAAYRAAGGYRLAAAVASGARDPETLIQTLEHAGLRGLGGAGFPAGRKWRIVRGFSRRRA